MSRLIWNLLLLHTVIRRFLSTYHSNLTFLKAAKSGEKTVMILILKFCLGLLNSFEIIFRQEASSVLQQKSQKGISSAFFYFLFGGNVFAQSRRSKVLLFHCKSTEWAGSSRGYSMKDFVCTRIFFSRHVLFYFSVLFYVNLHAKRVIHHTRLKQRVSVLTTVKENFASTSDCESVLC